MRLFFRHLVGAADHWVRGRRHRKGGCRCVLQYVDLCRRLHRKARIVLRPRQVIVAHRAVVVRPVDRSVEREIRR